MPYLATVTPFKGLRVYTTLVMGMPGSSEMLQELLSRIFGNEMMEGWILIIADDMYICSNTPSGLLRNWEVVLEKMNKNGLTLSAVKTAVSPKTFDVLGWQWKTGTLSITPHKITPLLLSEPPKTCSNMRSFIGSFKAMSRCIPRYSSLTSPLEESIKGLSGSQHIKWTDNLHDHFRQCQEALKSPKVLTVPTPEDKLVLTVDASPVNAGIGATLYVCRNDKRLTSECFSLKLKTHHLNWEPCELEALAIATAVKHFSPYIRDSHHPLHILTDNRPCTQAFAKLLKGQFSASARVSAFLSTLSQHTVIMSHLKGSNNTSSDFASRNPVTCIDSSCQICKFVEDLSHSVVCHLTVNDVLSGSVRMPFINKAAWRTAQHANPTLRRLYAHLTQGTRPSKKAKRVSDVKRYLTMCSLDNQGLIVVRRPDPYLHQRELIVVPDDILPGLLTALHIQFNHPTKYQLGKLFDRHFYAISSMRSIEEVVTSCSQCNALKVMKKELFSQSSSESPTAPGQHFACDVIERNLQKIFATRDVLTSYTTASIIPNQTADTLRSAILDGTSLIRLPSCVIRLDNAPGIQALKDDIMLSSQGIHLELGRVKNVNRNPVAERSNQELELELLRLDPSGSAVSPSVLQQALKTLNTRIRYRGLSAQEMLFCRDQSNGQQLTVDDGALSYQQRCTREENHPHSSKSKANSAPPAVKANITKGDLVFIKSEGDKNKPRELYIVTDFRNEMAVLQKLPGTKFQSRQYEVPLTQVFHAIKPSPNSRSYTNNPAEESTSSSEDSVVPDPIPVISNDYSSSDEGDSDDDGDNQNDDEQSIHPPLRRGTRIRNPPAWLASGEWSR